MVKKRNVIVLVLILALSAVISFFVIGLIYDNIYKIITQNDDFLYNAISFSAVIGGFLFTGVGILISAIDKERIKRLWDNHYLDNMYRFAILGIIFNVITFLVSWLIILVKSPTEELNKALVYIEISSLILGVVSFLVCIAYLISIMKKLHDD